MNTIFIPFLAATNVVVTTAADPNTSSGLPWGISWWWLGAAAVVAVAAVTVAKLIKAAPSAEKLDHD